MSALISTSSQTVEQPLCASSPYITLQIKCLNIIILKQIKFCVKMYRQRQVVCLGMVCRELQTCARMRIKAPVAFYGHKRAQFPTITKAYVYDAVVSWMMGLAVKLMDPIMFMDDCKHSCFLTLQWYEAGRLLIRDISHRQAIKE